MIKEYFNTIKAMQKQYKIIAKVDDDKFVKYHSRNLLSFVRFLDTKFPKWRWFNVYNHKGFQVANFTIKNRPTTKTLRS